jgi:hypothetical protein
MLVFKILWVHKTNGLFIEQSSDTVLLEANQILECVFGTASVWQAFV